MKHTIVLFVLFFIYPRAEGNPRKAYPHEIVGIIAVYKAPSIEFDDTPVEDAVRFILTKWGNIDWHDGAPYKFSVETDFSAVKSRTVTLKGKDMTVGRIIDALFPKHNYRYTISEGLLRFTATP